MGKWDGAVKIARKSSNITVSSVTGSCALLTAALLLLGGTSLQNAAADGDTRTLTLHHIHTNEDITITYKRNGRYDEEALKKLNWFVRDWRKEEEIQMDPQLFDVIWEVSREVAGDKTIYVVCGYRSPATNAMLRARSNGVAEFSQHTLGKAMDFYIPGASLEELRYAGLRLQRGGVGYYPTSGSPFVHLDVGSVRHWPRMSHDELARVFPNGRTVHVPSDDHPLPGYALALADIAKRGSSPPSQSSLGAARAVGPNRRRRQHRQERMRWRPRRRRATTRPTQRQTSPRRPDKRLRRRSRSPIRPLSLPPDRPRSRLRSSPRGHRIGDPRRTVCHRGSWRSRLSQAPPNRHVPR